MGRLNKRKITHPPTAPYCVKLIVTRANQLNLTYEEMAELSGYDSNTLRRITKGDKRPLFIHIETVLEAMGVKLVPIITKEGNYVAVSEDAYSREVPQSVIETRRRRQEAREARAARKPYAAAFVNGRRIR